MLVNVFLQNARWAFDPLSALIGAVIAWIIAGLLYANRAGVARLKEKFLSPMRKLKEQSQSSQEDKYITTLMERLRAEWLFIPQNPHALFQPPTFLSRPPLPVDFSEKEPLPPPLEIKFEHLLEGHPRLVITGALTSGRTSALTMLVWQTRRRAPQGQPYERFPVWINLARLKDLPESQETGPVERFAQLAALFIPELIPKWLIDHLKSTPALILVDNWDTLPADTRMLVALWFAEVAAAFPQSVWVVASGVAGYGPLTETGFAPLDIIPPTGELTLHALYRGWTKLLRGAEAEPPEEVIDTLRWAQDSGGPLVEMNLRTVAYLQTGQLPKRPVDVMDFYLDTRIPEINLGEEQETVAAHARMLALSVLSYIATTHRLQEHAFTRQEIHDYIASLLPPEAERHPKLEGAVRKLLFDSKLLKRLDKLWIPEHYLWADFLTAWMLAEDETGVAETQAHLDDPAWELLLEFYVGLGDATPLVKALLNQVAHANNREALLRLARWSMVADEEAAWRRAVMKALAQVVTMPKLEESLRMRLGRGLALTAGESSKALFLKALPHPAPEIRCLALRGLGWSGSTREMEILGKALYDENLDVSRSAVEALADMDTPGAARLLGSALSEVDERLILHISKALGRMLNGHKILQESVEHSDLMVRRAAAHGLALIDQPWAVGLLEQLVRQDKEWLVRSAAEAALETQKELAEAHTLVPPPPQVDQIEWLMTWAARRGVGLGLGEAAFEMLLNALAQGERPAKVLGALTLSYIGRAEHLHALNALRQDSDPLAQQAAQQAITAIERRYHVPDFG